MLWGIQFKALHELHGREFNIPEFIYAYSFKSILQIWLSSKLCNAIWCALGHRQAYWSLNLMCLRNTYALYAMYISSWLLSEMARVGEIADTKRRLSWNLFPRFRVTRLDCHTYNCRSFLLCLKILPQPPFRSRITHQTCHSYDHATQLALCH